MQPKTREHVIVNGALHRMLQGEANDPSSWSPVVEMSGEILRATGS